MDQSQSCPLCGQVDERPSMVMVRLPYPRVATHDTVIICRPCASAVAGRAIETEAEDKAGAEPGSPKHERKHESKGKSGRRAHGEAAAPDASDPSAA
jgi:hypothetical protein